MSTVTLAAENLQVGAVYHHNRDGGVYVEILKAKESCTDMFGREMFRYWAKRLDTDAEGWVTFGFGAEVTLREEHHSTPCEGPGGRECTNPRHDHFGQFETMVNSHGCPTCDSGLTRDGDAVVCADVPAHFRWTDDKLLCEDCSEPCHYDSGDENYHHDAPNAAPCFLIQDSNGGGAS